MTVVVDFDVVIVLEKEIPDGIAAGALDVLALRVIIVVVIPHLNSHAVTVHGCGIVYSRDMNTDTSLNRRCKHSCRKKRSGKFHLVAGKGFTKKIVCSSGTGILMKHELENKGLWTRFI